MSFILNIILLTANFAIRTCILKFIQFLQTLNQHFYISKRSPATFQVVFKKNYLPLPLKSLEEMVYQHTVKGFLVLSLQNGKMKETDALQK